METQKGGFWRGDDGMSEKKIYDFFCRSIKWVRCEQERMTEEEAIKYAKEKDYRFEELGVE